MKRKAALEVRSLQQFRQQLEREYKAAVSGDPDHPNKPVLKAGAAEKYENAKGKLLITSC